ncbi:MAG TPA: O-antigen ligase family protein [Nocardioidaceae bacterium]|nr:O-antigen ligase family protein [Nocardioidaceae bacterium]
MNTFVFRLMILMTITLPWENVVNFPGAGKVSKVIGLIVGVAWLVSVLMSGKVRQPRAAHVFAILFVLWNACSMAWTVDGPATQTRVLTYMQLLGFMLVVWDTVTTAARARQVLLAYVIGCYLTVTFLLISSAQPTGGTQMYGRATLDGFHPNDLAAILAFGAPIAVYLIFAPGTDRWHLARLIGGCLYIPLAGFAVLLTGSRSGLAALLPAIVFLVYQIARRHPGMAIGSLGALVALAALAFPLAPPRVRLRLEGTAENLQAGNLNSRETVWAEAFRLIQDHPVLGVGAGAFREAAVGANKVGHNFALSLLAEVGVVGFGLFMAMLIAALLPIRHLSPLLRGMWVALFTAWLFSAVLHNWEYRKQTWLFIALVIAYGALSDRRHADDDSENGAHAKSGGHR